MSETPREGNYTPASASFVQCIQSHADVGHSVGDRSIGPRKYVQQVVACSSRRALSMSAEPELHGHTAGRQHKI